MERWKMICVCSAASLCFSLLGIWVCLPLQGESPQSEAGRLEDGVEEGTLSERWECRQESAAERLLEFAEAIYTYDTAERMFYEGAERFMTDEAYRNFVPLVDWGADLGPPVQMKSRLLESRPYFNFTGRSADALMESRFTLSEQGRGCILQYLKLTMRETEEGWIITSCHILDTLEQ